MMGVPHERLVREAKVNNTELFRPPPETGPLSEGLQLRCEYNSWQVCANSSLDAASKKLSRLASPQGDKSLSEPAGRQALRPNIRKIEFFIPGIHLPGLQAKHSESSK